MIYRRNTKMRTDETIVPSDTFKISNTRSLIREEVLKLWQRARKRQIASLKNIDHHGDSSAIQRLNILDIVGGCKNRISRV